MSNLEEIKNLFDHFLVRPVISQNFLIFSSSSSSVSSLQCWFSGRTTPHFRHLRSRFRSWTNLRYFRFIICEPWLLFEWIGFGFCPELVFTLTLFSRRFLMSLSNKKSGGQLFDLLFFWLWALFILAPLRRDLAGDFIIMLCVCVSSQLDRLYSTDPFKFKLARSIWFRYSLPFEQKIGTKFRFRYNLNIEVKWQKWRNWDPHCPVSSVQCHSGGLDFDSSAIWDENWRRYVICIAGMIIPQMAKCQNIRKVKLYHHSARPLEPGLCQEHLCSQPNDFWLWVMSPPWIKTENTLDHTWLIIALHEAIRQF